MTSVDERNAMTMNEKVTFLTREMDSMRRQIEGLNDVYHQSYELNIRQFRTNLELTKDLMRALRHCPEDWRQEGRREISLSQLALLCLVAASMKDGTRQVVADLVPFFGGSGEAMGDIGEILSGLISRLDISKINVGF